MPARAFLATLVLVAIGAWQAATPSVASAAGRCGGARAADFDGDGIGDLAAGVTREDVGPNQDAGAVHVIYGSAGGLVAAGNQFLTTADAGIQVEPDNMWGWALAPGDFDGDGMSDLAVSMPYDNIDSTQDAGAVIVFYGSSTGLDRSASFVQGRAGLENGPGTSDQFGWALAAGDFDGDGFCDLAVGVPGEKVVGTGGAVHVIYGSPEGLTATRDELWHEDSPGILGAAEPDEDFGYALTAADFGKSAAADLAISVLSQQVGSLERAGAVHIIYGSATGLTAAGDQVWHEDSPGILGTAQTGDSFGEYLASGDVGRGRQADLAIGVPSQEVGTTGYAGAVHVIYGSPSGLTATGDEIWSHATAGIVGAVQEAEEFGKALAIADFGKGRRADLAVGVPYRDVGPETQAGAVHIIYGSSSGLTAVGDELWHKDRPGTMGTALEDAGYGWALAAADFGHGSRRDLAVGVPYEDVGAATQAGSVHVLYGTSTGISASGDQVWHQERTGIPGSASDFDDFGVSLGRIR